MPNIDALALLSNTPGHVSTWYGPTINRSSDLVVWNGIVVPNPQKGKDEFDICIYLRIPVAGEPLGGLMTGFKYGDFRFGNSNTGLYAQAEQAVRLAMYGDGSFYEIPFRNWIQDVLLGSENHSLRDQGRGSAPQNPPVHPSHNNKLTPKQRQAFLAAISNTRQGVNWPTIILY